MIDNTALKEADEALRKSDERLRRFYESGMVGVVNWNMNGLIEDANDKFLEMVGYTREELVAGRIDWIEMTPPEYRHLDEKCMQELIATGVNRDPFEKEYVCKDGRRIPVLLSGAVLDHDAVAGIAFILDITSRKKTEAALFSSEERYRRLFEVESDALLLVDWDSGRFIDANTAAVNLYGYSKEDLLNLTQSDLTDEPQLSAQALREKQTFVTLRRHRKKDGTLFPVEIAGSYFEYQGLSVYVAAIRDISARVRDEAQLIELNNKLRTLTEHVQTIQEQERLSIARDIHDEIGQQLTALKLDIVWLGHHLEMAGDETIERLDAMGSCIDLLVSSIQRIAADLRPPLLDNLGLSAAIEWQVGEFTKHSGIECVLMLNEDADPDDQQTSTMIVRIVQEALTNVIRHSGASEVGISLCKADYGLLLEISDNGRGVSEQEIAAQDSYGLMGMQERARLCRGELVIYGSPGLGTCLRLTLPCAEGGSGL